MIGRDWIKDSNLFCRSVQKIFRGLGGFVVFLAVFFPLASAEEIKYDSGGRRNPFIPLVTPEGAVTASGQKKTGEFKVEGIIFDPSGGSFALINGKFYKEGERIENAQIITIFKDRVILSVNDAEKVIWLREEIVGRK